MLSSLRRYVFVPMLLVIPMLYSRDTLLEFKVAGFVPTHQPFKDIYHNAVLFGPEVTFQFADCSPWYGFASVDFLHKKGKSIGLCDPTTLNLVALGLGIKYFIPLVCDRVDFYLGLGFQPVYVQTKNNSEFVVEKLSRWGFGGIAKVGTYVYLPHNLFLDFFIDYSFAKVGCNSNNCDAAHETIFTKANVSGAIFGAGLGYCF